MKSAQLLDGLVFDETNPHAVALYVDKYGRAIRWTLEPGQSIKVHEVPQSPFYIVVLQGHGWFCGGDQKEERFGPNTLLIFEPDEPHHIRAEQCIRKSGRRNRAGRNLVQQHDEIAQYEVSIAPKNIGQRACMPHSFMLLHY